MSHTKPKQQQIQPQRLQKRQKKNTRRNTNRYKVTTGKKTKEQGNIKRVGQIGDRQRRNTGMAKKRSAQLGRRTSYKPSLEHYNI